MNPNKVVREKISKLTDLPNIGKAGAGLICCRFSKGNVEIVSMFIK